MRSDIIIYKYINIVVPFIQRSLELGKDKDFIYNYSFLLGGRCDRMVVGFTTTCVISAYPLS